MARVFQKKVTFVGAPIQLLGPNPNRKAVYFSNDGSFRVDLGFGADVGATNGFPILVLANIRPEKLDDSNCPGWLTEAIFARGSGAGGDLFIIEVSNP